MKMQFFKKTLEFKKLAEALNGIIYMIEELDNVDDFESIGVIAYLIRTQVLDSFDKYSWNLNSKIIVPAISNRAILLSYAVDQSLIKTYKISEIKGYFDEVQSILEHGYMFYEIENSIPIHLKKMVL